MAANGGAAVEELGRRADWHPPFCNLRHDIREPHESHLIVVDIRRLWATWDGGWKVTVHEDGAGPLRAGDQVWRDAAETFLRNLACEGR